MGMSFSSFASIVDYVQAQLQFSAREPTPFKAVASRSLVICYLYLYTEYASVLAGLKTFHGIGAVHFLSSYPDRDKNLSTQLSQRSVPLKNPLVALKEEKGYPRSLAVANLSYFFQCHMESERKIITPEVKKTKPPDPPFTNGRNSKSKIAAIIENTLSPREQSMR